MQNILIIEDEEELANILASYLELEGFQATTAFDGEIGFSKFCDGEYDLVLLDIMLPKMDGMEVCKRIRSTSKIPVIMISAKSGEMDKVIALGVGADDYVTKPFSPLELVARVKAQLRRAGEFSLRDNVAKKEYGRISINEGAYIAKVDGKVLDLTTKEFQILSYFIHNKGIVVSKEQIYLGVWGESGMIDENAVIVYINRIRDKLKKEDIDYIKTVWGVGYKFVSDEFF